MPAVQGYFCQSDLNNFQTWSSDNLLCLNGSDCKVRTFCRINQYATYTLYEGSLDRITLVNDIGVLLDPRPCLRSSPVLKAGCHPFWRPWPISHCMFFPLQWRWQHPGDGYEVGVAPEVLFFAFVLCGGAAWSRPLAVSISGSKGSFWFLTSFF